MPIQDTIRKFLCSFGPSAENGILGPVEEIRRQGWVLLAQTYALFRTEIREKARLLARDSLIILLCGTFLWVSLLAFVAASISVLSFFVPVWLAALIVSIFFGILGTALSIAGIVLFRRRRIAPQLAAEAFRDNVRWLKAKMEWTDRTAG